MWCKNVFGKKIKKSENQKIVKSIFFLFQEFVGVSVEYITMPGWKSSIAGCKVYEDLPANAKKYIETIEQYLNIPGIFL